MRLAGFCIFVAAVLLHPRSFGEATWQIVDEVLNEGTYVAIATAWRRDVGRVPVSLLHVDEAAHLDDGRPGRTSRDWILRAIDTAVKHQAAVIVIDIDLTDLGCISDEAGKLECASPDQLEAIDDLGEVEPQLREAAQRWNEEVALAQRIRDYAAPPTLVLIDPARPDRGDQHAVPAAWLKEQAHAILASAPLVFAVDDVVRDWPLDGASGARKDASLGRCHAVLVAVWSWSVGDKANPFHDMLKSLGVVSPGNLDARPRHCRDDDRGVPIPFTVSWADIGPPPGQPHSASRSFHRLRPAAARTPNGFLAAPVTELDRLGERFFKDRIVVVGATHGDISDSLLTPLGQMPGVLVLANAMNGAMAAVPLVDRPSSWMELRPSGEGQNYWRPRRSDAVMLLAAGTAVLSWLFLQRLWRPFGAVAVVILALTVAVWLLPVLRLEALTYRFLFGAVACLAVWEALSLAAQGIDWLRRRKLG